jgi:hypothetical protein
METYLWFVQIIGRDKRMEFAESFFTCYNFRLMYTSGTQYPIVGAFRCVHLNWYLLLSVENLSRNGHSISTYLDL